MQKDTNYCENEKHGGHTYNTYNSYSCCACRPSNDGNAGAIPSIGDNGNWFIGEEDTGIKAQGGNLWSQIIRIPSAAIKTAGQAQKPVRQLLKVRWP